MLSLDARLGHKAPEFLELNDHWVRAYGSDIWRIRNCLSSNIKHDSNKLICILEITPSFYQIFHANFESGWIVFHLESSSKEA